jgi:hypothetical protein
MSADAPIAMKAKFARYAEWIIRYRMAVVVIVVLITGLALFQAQKVKLIIDMNRVFGYVDPRGISDPLSRSIGIENAIATHQLDSHKQGVSFRFSKKWINDTLVCEIATVISLSTSDFILKPRLIYAVNDQIKMSAGVDLFRGNKNTFFGRLKDTSTAFVEFKYSF